MGVPSEEREIIAAGILAAAASVMGARMKQSELVRFASSWRASENDMAIQQSVIALSNSSFVDENVMLYFVNKVGQEWLGGWLQWFVRNQVGNL